MKAYKYKVKVYEGTLAFAHNMGYEIDEVYIPEKHIVFNSEDDNLNVFFGKEPRNKDYKEIKIGSILADGLEQFMKTRQTLGEEVKEVLKQSDKSNEK